MFACNPCFYVKELLLASPAKVVGVTAILFTSQLGSSTKKGNPE
jgi:hypothetical protein